MLAAAQRLTTQDVLHIQQVQVHNLFLIPQDSWGVPD